MKIVFISEQSSTSKSAYNHRLSVLKVGVGKLGAKADIVYLGDYFFKHPRIIQILNLPFLVRKLRQYDFIHAGNPSCACFSAVFKIFNKTTVIYDVHGDVISEMLLYWRSIWNLRRAFHYFQTVIMECIARNFSNFFLVVSNPLRQKLIDEGINENNISLVRNGVDLELFKRDSVCKVKKFIVCYAGGTQKWQGIENFINAVSMVDDNEITFQMIGFGKKDEALKSKINLVLGSRVALINRQPQDELINTLAQASVLIIPRLPHPAVRVALPTKFAEYLALGKPVIVTNVDETAEFVKKHNCGIVSEPDPCSLSNAIIRMKKLDDATRKLMGDNARKLAEAVFDWDIICRKYYDWLAALKDKNC